MSDFQGFKLNPFQEEFVFDPAEVLAGYGGIGNGKTEGGSMRAMELVDAFPGNVGLIGRLTYPELKDTTEKQFLNIVRSRNGGHLNPGPYVKRFVQNPDTLELRNGSTVLFRYLENEQSILNLNLGFCWVDQAEFIKEAVILHLLGRLRWWTTDKVLAFQKKFRRTPKHYAFFTGNPAPGWVERSFKQRKMADGKPTPAHWKLIEAPTSANIENLPPNYIDNLRSSYPEAWVKRYLLGDWTTFTGQVYKEFNRQTHVIEPFNIPSHWPRYIGWDHGKTNPTAVSFLAVDEAGNFIVYKEYYAVSAVIKEHADAIKMLCRGDSVPRAPDNHEAILVWMDPQVAGDTDPTGKDFRQLYQELGIIGLVANKKVAAGIEKISAALHPDPTHPYPAWHPRGERKDGKKVVRPAELGSPRFFIFSDCHSHLHEMELYRYEERKLGEEKNAKEEPLKYMDHAMDAMRYAGMAAFEKAQPLEKKPNQAPPAPPPFLEEAMRKLLALG